MNPIFISEQKKKLYLQRNILFSFFVVLLISNVFLSVIAFSKKDRTVIVPALDREVEVVGEEFSESYVEQMTVFFLELLLDLTPENIDYKSKLLLTHVALESYHEIFHYYQDEQQRHKQYRLSTKFDLHSVEISGLKVRVGGILSSRFGEDASKQLQVSYEISYKKTGGKLQLKSFTKEDS